MLLLVRLRYVQVVQGSIRCSSVMFGGLFYTVTGPFHASNCFHELENQIIIFGCNAIIHFCSRIYVLCSAEWDQIIFENLLQCVIWHFYL